MTDKTNYAQSLMHMIKGNLGTGILAMPASFAHTGLINALIGLPFLCFIATYCVHLIIKSSQHLEGKSKGLSFKYASLAKHSFKSGPKWMSRFSSPMCLIVDGTLLVAQLGVCCVYLVFVVDNITSILASYHMNVGKTPVFFAILPIALLLSYIRTLKRLAIASACANLLQAVGISIIVEYLIRDIGKVNMAERDNFRPLNEVALGFGSAMFAFEGISVVLPVYTGMKQSERMSGPFGVINMSYIVLLILYFLVGLLGFLRYGHEARGSITLNLPPEPIYDVVRAMFAISVFLTYPLQFYVPNEIIWNWAKKNIFIDTAPKITVVKALEGVAPAIKISEKVKECNGETKTDKIDAEDKAVSTSAYPNYRQNHLNRFDYCCRTLVVIFTFILAVTVPKLNLLMDLIGSITGTALSLVLPALIHIATFWDDTTGLKRFILISVDSVIILLGLFAGASGSVFSLTSIINSF